MADIELVIKMPEDLYKATINGLDANEIWNLRLAVKNGIPLPEYHGNLKDTGEIIEKIRRLPNAGIQWFVNAKSVFDIILDAPTIIEGSDKE